MLKKLETEFCIRVLRERFDLCLKIGRDLVRLLQDLVHIAEFKSIWKDLLFNPGEFRVNDFKSMVKIYRLKTQSLYFSLRITPEMERNLRFLLTNVKFGNQKRYQAWFAKKFLSCSERETLLVDIARKSYIEANFKLALFYDWLFFCEEGDDVMRAEPAILLMANSIPKYSDITNALLEFLLILIDNYDAERKDVIVNGVLSVFHALLMNGVIDSLDVLAHSDALSPVLREMLKKLLSFMETSHTKELQ
ncbi:unnamed protein product [Cuscuta campestris]|uniref:Integrator complex subunit 3 N-terminal domain-containing protein n=1 Tax=Cuscuta campestris TaxID=132261 RepID=A0A484NKF2_9ASTE|nr:unnamed protein product [Cuscuta campestris]